jgi:hypothetical protein
VRDEIANSDLRQDMNESEININVVFFLFFEKFFQQKKHRNFRERKRERERGSSKAAMGDFSGCCFVM